MSSFLCPAPDRSQTQKEPNRPGVRIVRRRFIYINIVWVFSLGRPQLSQVARPLDPRGTHIRLGLFPQVTATQPPRPARCPVLRLDWLFPATRRQKERVSHYDRPLESCPWVIPLLAPPATPLLIAGPVACHQADPPRGPRPCVPVALRSPPPLCGRLRRRRA